LVGEERARQGACLTGVCIVVALSGLFVRALPKVTARQLLTVGASWLALTLAFEFLFGHFVAGMTWAALLEDYNLLRGRLWVFVLLATFLSPWFWGVMRGGRRG
jgi:hypothetical protein